MSDPPNVRPLTPERWDDLEALFGPSGAYSGCWCTYLRQTSARFNANAGAANRALFRELVVGGGVPGLLAYDADAAVGWVAVAPREEYPRVLRSPVHRPADDLAPVWAVTCFFIARSHRGRGVAARLLDAAVARASEGGAIAVEAYPAGSGAERVPAASMWRGSEALFRRAGFEPVIERRPGRPVMRRRVG